MSRWLIVAVLAGLSACGNKVELAECTAFPPPASFSEEQCLAWGADAGCALSRRDTINHPDGGLTTTCHHENCSSKPYCPSAP
ncbi:MAG: hypothetical protein IT380_02105 [Myxococcales bacterium]|nr:hypothetical protein [Myxococcales bacterium]